MASEDEPAELHPTVDSPIPDFQQGVGTSCIDEKIELDGEALGEVGQLHSRAEALFTKFEGGEGTRYMDEAIDLDREALELCPPGHPERSVALTHLAIDLSNRCDHLGVARDLGEAIVLAREGLDLRPAGHSGRWVCLNTLAACLSTRHKQLGKTEDIDEAAVLNRAALDLRPKGHPEWSMSLNNLALCLSIRYQQFGEMEDLDEAIVLNRKALEVRPPEHRLRPSSLNNLALCLSTRYEQLGEIENLDEAIVLGREALDIRPQGHPLRFSSLMNLALCLFSRYERLGAMEDLDEAIVLDRGALSLCPEGHPVRSMTLINLANCLSTRYTQLGAVEDNDEAIVLAREALDLHQRGHPDRSMSLDNLANHLSFRYNRLRTTEDLNEAIVLDREAMELRPQGHPLRSSSLNNLASHLSSRYQQLGTKEDLDEAIALNREALDLHQKGHPNRSISLNNLAVNLYTRYQQLEAVEDRDEAIILVRGALALCPPGYPNRSEWLSNLTRYLLRRFECSKQLQDKVEIFTLYAQLAHMTPVVFSSDLSAARAWIRAAEDFQHPTRLLAYEISLRSLVQLLTTLPSLPRHLVILKNLTSSLAVDAFSACLRNCSPANAVELLEQGRGVFWSQLTRFRSPLDDVIASGPAGKTLADEFRRLASLIRNTLDSPVADQHERACHLNLEMRRVVANIRELPGLSRFLLPSLFSDLQRAASGGPVIIVNSSKYSCDALVVFLDRDPVRIPLQITQESVRGLSMELHTLSLRTTKADVTKELAFFLRKLWDQIVSPIVDLLRTTLPSQSRIWWCPTGEFSVLPLHAAGPFRKGQQNLPNIYISSYIPTLTALIRARRCDQSNSATEQKRFIAIGQAEAVGESELFSVCAELDAIGQRVDALTTFTRIQGDASCISRVVEELGKNEWVHFACHGLPNRKQPFESAFALCDGHFTIQRIIGCHLKNPEFAYLSACHTTVGDEQSPDEVIHLASAMQFAGFRSVIGTMWAVDDGETNEITSTFYKHMVDESGHLDHTRAAFALNKTMRSVNVPLDQRILYIHLGA